MRKIIIAFVLLSTVYCDCKLSQSYITLGNRFSDPNSPHIYSVGVVAEGNCENPPNITLHTQTGKGISISYEMKEDYHFEGVFNSTSSLNYTRTSYFFNIEKQHVSEYSSYSIEGLISQFPPRTFTDAETTKIALVGDFDETIYAQPTIKALHGLNDLDMFMHLGDFAYDIQDQNGMTGDHFFETMSKTISSRIPYVITGGNHEWVDNGNLFQYRFKMPGTDSQRETSFRRNFYYSFDYKGVHYVSLDFDYIFEYSQDKQMNAFDWLNNDLRTYRAGNPDSWIIFFTHRPFLSGDVSETTNEDCKRNFWYFRKYEVLLQKYGVQLVLNGHIHMYIRSKPFKDWKMNEGGYISIVIGHSGTTHYFPPPSYAKTIDTAFVENVMRI